MIYSMVEWPHHEYG